jgi:hypothetical protein
MIAARRLLSGRAAPAEHAQPMQRIRAAIIGAAVIAGLLIALT